MSFMWMFNLNSSTQFMSLYKAIYNGNIEELHNISKYAKERFTTDNYGAIGSYIAEYIETKNASHEDDIESEFYFNDIIIEKNEHTSALYLASCRGHLEIVDLLINTFDLQKEDILMINNKKKTALYGAIRHGHTQIVKLLLAYCDNLQLLSRDEIMMRDEDGNTLLHIACQNNYVEITKLLIELYDKYILQKEDIMKQNIYDTCKYLIEKYNLQKEDIMTANHLGITPLHNALDCRCIKIFDLLIGPDNKFNLQKKDILAKNYRGITALHIAHDSNNLYAIKKMLELCLKENLSREEMISYGLYNEFTKSVKNIFNQMSFIKDINIMINDIVLSI